MIWLSTSAFVLALVACGCAVAVLITSSIHARALERWRSQTASDLTKLEQRIEKQSERSSAALRALEAQTPAKLAAEVAALAAALDTLAAQHRKLSGQFHATKAAPRPVANGDTDDDELAAVLALQTAKPSAPSH